MEKKIHVVNLNECPSVEAQGFKRIPIFSTRNVGDQISLEYVVLPKGAEATPHSHIGVHTVVYTLQGGVRIYFGEDLDKQVIVRPQGCVYIPPDVIHYVVNEHEEDMVAIVARTPYDYKVKEYQNLLSTISNIRHF